jgi:hypothetical protein
MKIDSTSRFGFKRITLGKIASVVAAIPGVSNLVGLANAVYDAFRKPDLQRFNPSFLYAAYAQREVLKV